MHGYMYVFVFVVFTAGIHVSLSVTQVNKTRRQLLIRQDVNCIAFAAGIGTCKSLTCLCRYLMILCNSVVIHVFCFCTVWLAVALALAMVTYVLLSVVLCVYLSHIAG